MKLDSSLASMVFNSVRGSDTTDLITEDIVMVELLTYAMVSNMIESKTIPDGSISDTVSKYSQSYINTIKSLKNKYTAYFRMKKVIKDYGIESILTADSTMVDYIEKIYVARNKLLVFSHYEFNPLMYNIDKLPTYYFNRLSDIHFKIMIPIFQFYKSNYNIKNEDFIIEDALVVVDNPGKKIMFRIEGITSPTICAHLNMDTIGVKTYLYNITLEDDSVLITIK